MRQCHVVGVVRKQLKSIVKQSQHYCIQGIFKVQSTGRKIVAENTSFLLPTVADCKVNDRIGKHSAPGHSKKADDLEKQRNRQGKVKNLATRK